MAPSNLPPDQARHAGLANRTPARVRAEEASKMRGDSKNRNLAGIIEEKAQSRKERLEARLREAEEALDQDPNASVSARLRASMPLIASMVGVLVLVGFVAFDLFRQTSPSFVLVPGTALNPTVFGARLINRGSLWNFQDVIWTCRVDKLGLADGRVLVDPPTSAPQREIALVGPGTAANLPCTVNAQLDGVLVASMAVYFQVTYRTNILGLLTHQQVLTQTFLVKY